jgi:hypothetical protein
MNRLLACALVALVAACGSNDKTKCDPVAQTGCGSGQVCEAVQSGTPACFAPVLVLGTVADLSTGALLNGAHVVALDPNGAPLSTVAVTANNGTTNGAYELKVPATRDAAGKPVQASLTLRADEQGYQTFPGGVRTALPIELSGATLVGGSWVASGSLTALKLAPLASAGTTFIHGSVAKAPSGAGRLVVAEPVGGGTGMTGVADEAGNYSIFNLTPGTAYVVTAYTKGANYTPVTTSALAAGDNAVAALALGSGTGAPLAGGLIFNNGAGSNIQVTLVVQSTYVPSLDRGESPPGLTIQGGASGYAFDGVPDGKYVVLAAFGLDGDVRDVSGTGNTAAPQVTIQSGAVVGTPPGFKIIPAVDLLSIGGTTVSATPVVLTGATAPTPTFVWQPGSVDASADHYRVDVFDSFGTTVFTTTVLNSTTSVAYAGPTLQAGMYYQLRISALKAASQLSQTEDVAGVFTWQPQ